MRKKLSVEMLDELGRVDAVGTLDGKPVIVEHKTTGPIATTPFGTKVEVLTKADAGSLLMVRRLNDNETFVCSFSALTGVTTEDQQRLSAYGRQA